MARPTERRFTTFSRGVVRDEIILASFRNSLRNPVRINPDTKAPFTEDEIARITAEESRFFVEADAIDLYGQGKQSRGIWLADQMDPRKASTAFLRGRHAPLWGVVPLQAVGGSGTVNALATPGSVFLGSTQIGAPGVHIAVDPAGKKYQVLTNTTTPASGVALLTLKGIDVGSQTNPKEGTILTWSTRPTLADPTCIVFSPLGLPGFSGGIEAETDSQLSGRIVDRIRFRASCGNNAHTRAWAREASVAVETAFVYATALHSGSTVVCVLQRRGTTVGPLARIASAGTLADVTAYMTPPGSPVMPERVFVLVVTAVSQPSDYVLRLGMRKGVQGGWFNATPWPGFTSVKSTVQASPAPTQTSFRINSDTTLPGGVSSLSGASAPAMMVWDQPTSRWERLNVTSVVSVGGGLWTVNCSSPVHVMATGDVISPYTDRALSIAQANESYFDSLGSGEVVNLTTDIRGTRAARFPRPNTESQQRVGQGLISRLEDVLGGLLDVAELTGVSVSTPSLPTDITTGPRLLTLGKVGIYAID